MDKEQIQAALAKAKDISDKRNFKQTYDLIINLKDLDLKKTEQQVDFFTALHFTKGKKTAAARILGINRRTLYRRKKSKAAQAEVLRDGSLLDATMPGPSTQVQ